MTPEIKPPSAPIILTPDVLKDNCRVLQIHPADNAGILIGPAVDGLPSGHKVALRAIRAGESVIKYGDPIGFASQDIAAGEWIHTHNLKTGLNNDHFLAAQVQKAAAPAAGPGQAQDAAPEKRPAGTGFFNGYCRPDGQVGLRNEIWIIPTVGCVNKTVEHLARYGQAQIAAGIWPGIDGVYGFTHPYGCSQLGDDHVKTRQILADLARHPNAGAVLIVGLGCENNQIDGLKAEIGSSNPDRLAFFATQEVDDEEKTGQKLLGKLADYAGQFTRQPCSVDKLIVGLKCGGSDAFSGLTANPLLGRFSDWLTAAGGSTLLTEVPEMFGAEHLLLRRAANPDVFQRLDGLFADFRTYYTQHDLPVYENPSPGNKAGGITTLEEKSLGCTQKAGSSPIVDVIRYGSRIRKPGLTILEGPGNDIVASTALAAAGAQIILFTTGRGTPLGSPVPTLKIASNTILAGKKPHWIDLDAGQVLLSPAKRDETDQQLVDLVLSVASGEVRTRNETHDYREIAIFKNGVTL
ncbi:MAG: altronate dehydratase family protein [Clostridiaceae bacterium]|nr:altronate dehydratase family protein [Clostridiaceae bacterium]